MGVAMRSMGLEENRALTLARGCGRSLAALARLIPGGAYELPAWLQKGRELLPAILAGGGIRRIFVIARSLSGSPAELPARKSKGTPEVSSEMVIRLSTWRGRSGK
jgi:hypothetical protein